MARQKVITACDSCRRRKVKCDAERPACHPCIIRGDPNCTYSKDKTSRRRQHALLPQCPPPQPPEWYMNMSTASEGTSTLSLAARTVDRRPSGQASTCSPFSTMTDASISSATPTLPLTTGTLPSKATGNTPQSADAMTGIGKNPLASMEFFGDSSAVSFTTQINSAVNARLGQNQTPSTSEAANDDDEVNVTAALEAASTSSSDCIDLLAFALPPRNFSDQLLQDYYDLVWVILPTHDWAIFRQDYNAVWAGGETKIPVRPLHCMINMALALGSQFSQAVEPGKRRELGQTFWKRALVLFDPRIQERASLEGVQCLLLMGLFLQSTHQSHQCWMVVGSAVRLAQSLGLHLSGTTTLTKNVRDMEMLRRTWHGCVFMDRIMSMTFGRPSMIANWLYDAVPPPSMIDDEFLDTQSKPSAVRPDGGGTPTIAFFIKSVELYSIVNDCLLELYMQQPQNAGESVGHIASVLQFDDRLVHWMRSVPEGLLYPSPANANYILQRQRIVLRSRYLHARIVVLRPILTESCLKRVRSDDTRQSAPVDQCLSDNLIDQCSNVCFESAYEIIRIIYTNLDFETVTGPVPAWWFAVLFVYTAATVLLAERFRQLTSNGSIMEPWSAEPTWNQAIQLLKAYSKVGESAERCVVALEILLAKIQGCRGSSRAPAEAVTREVSQSMFIDDGQNTGLAACDNLAPMMSLDGMNLDIDDMLWLNTSAAEILF